LTLYARKLVRKIVEVASNLLYKMFLINSNPFRVARRFRSFNATYTATPNTTHYNSRRFKEEKR
jgi:hypothetical protein